MCDSLPAPTPLPLSPSVKSLSDRQPHQPSRAWRGADASPHTQAWARHAGAPRHTQHTVMRSTCAQANRLSAAPFLGAASDRSEAGAMKYPTGRCHEGSPEARIRPPADPLGRRREFCTSRLLHTSRPQAGRSTAQQVFYKGWTRAAPRGEHTVGVRVLHQLETALWPRTTKIRQRLLAWCPPQAKPRRR